MWYRTWRTRSDEYCASACFIAVSCFSMLASRIGPRVVDLACTHSRHKPLVLCVPELVLHCACLFLLHVRLHCLYAADVLFAGDIQCTQNGLAMYSRQAHAIQAPKKQIVLQAPRCAYMMVCVHLPL